VGHKRLAGGGGANSDERENLNKKEKIRPLGKEIQRGDTEGEKRDKGGVIGNFFTQGAFPAGGKGGGTHERTDVTLEKDVLCRRSGKQCSKRDIGKINFEKKKKYTTQGIREEGGNRERKCSDRSL